MSASVRRRLAAVHAVEEGDRGPRRAEGRDVRDFCRGNLDYGGCGEYVERVTAAVAAGDLAQAQKEIGHVLEAFEAMRFDVA